MSLFDLDKISSEIKELEQKTMEDGFWNDTNTSSKVLQDIKSLKGKYNKFNKLSTELKNLEELNKAQKVVRKVDSVYDVKRKK